MYQVKIYKINPWKPSTVFWNYWWTAEFQVKLMIFKETDKKHEMQKIISTSQNQWIKKNYFKLVKQKCLKSYHKKLYNYKIRKYESGGCETWLI